MSSNEDLVPQFMAITGSSDASVAMSFIEMAGGQLDVAINLFMEHGGGNNSGGPAAAAGGPNMGSSGGATSMMDADAALAASMAAQDQEEDAIRAPDATRTMRLMDETGGSMGMGMMMMGSGGGGGGAGGAFNMNMMDPNMRMMQELMDEQLNRPSAFAAPSRGSRRRGARDAVDAAAEAKDDDDDDDDNHDYTYDDDDDDDDVQMEDEEEENMNGGGTVNPPRLSDMFAAPTHLMHTAGGFMGARQMAKDSKRWLLVNIQKDSEFSSHALNRDVWRNDLVENLVREGFIFWQEMDTHPEGQQFVQRYQVHQFPHISFIDPRTGRLLWKKEGWTQQNPLTAERCSEMITDFCSRNSLDRPPVAPKPPGGKGSQSTSMSSVTSNTMEKSADFMTEEEQLEAAVKASMEDSTKPPAAATESNGFNDNNNNGGGGNDEVEFLGNSPGAAAAAAASAAPNAPLSFAQELLEMTVPEETEGGSKISFRLPTGSRVVRSFDGSLSVKVVYAFVAQSLADEIQNDPTKKEFSLKAGFPPKDLKARMDETIDQCTLKGEAVTVRWV